MNNDYDVIIIGSGAGGGTLAYRLGPRGPRGLNVGRGEPPTEAWRPSNYPYRAVPHEPRIQKLHDDFARAGLNPFHLPVGVMLDEANPQASPCIRCSKLDGFPCMVEAKADAHVCAVRPALRHENVTLLTNAKVERLETDESGNAVTGVIVDHDGVPERYRADVVVV